MVLELEHVVLEHVMELHHLDAQIRLYLHPFDQVCMDHQILLYEEDRFLIVNCLYV
jgi:hypothetical protein